MNDNIKLAIAIPLSWDYVPYDFMESYLGMKKPVAHLFIRAGGYTGLAEMRCQLVNAAKHYDCTHILFLDTDHKHNPNTIPKLLSHNKPIVSGLSFMRYDPFEPAMFRGRINEYKTITEWNDGDLIEVDGVGGACLLVEMSVFEKLERPFFKFMKNPDPTSEFNIGEDIYFCNLAKKNGYKIYVDTSCPNDHIGKIDANQKLWEKWKTIEEK